MSGGKKRILLSPSKLETASTDQTFMASSRVCGSGRRGLLTILLLIANQIFLVNAMKGWWEYPWGGKSQSSLIVHLVINTLGSWMRS